MTKSYFIGSNSSAITIQVTISTPGFAISRVDKEIPGSSTEDIADSPVDGIGDVPQTEIGPASTLNECTIEIDTIIELQNVLPPDQWQTCFDNLVCKYIFTGGNHGTQTFDCDPDDKKKSASGATITVAKMILLTNK